jgi:hypothetical protein
MARKPTKQEIQEGLDALDRFLGLYRRGRRLSKKYFFEQVSIELLAVYRLALLLGDQPYPKGCSIKCEKSRRPSRVRGIDMAGLDYTHVFDPTGDKEPIKFNAALDLGDIFSDLELVAHLDKTCGRQHALYRLRSNVVVHSAWHILGFLRFVTFSKWGPI